MVDFSENLPQWIMPGLVLLLLLLIVSLLWRNRQLTVRLRVQSEELKESEESYRYLVDNAHDGIVIVQNKRLVYVNQRMSEMTGYDESALLALDTFLPLIAPSAREIMLENHLRRLEGKASPSRYESLFLKRDGTIYPIEITGVLINWRNKPATLNVVTDISARKAAEEAVQFLAHHDSLTNLPNRYVFRQRLEYSIAQARRSGKPLAVIFIDLNGFKQVNDTYGHDVGDQLLREVSARLNKQVRDSDTLARIGGDEFVILMPCIEGAESVNSLIDRIDTVFQPDFQIEQLRLTSSASFGYAFYPEDGETPADLLKKADQKMYSNKRAQCER
ncbi:sensor domain-containing diguanylate cyclase [Neptuniibacter halophilus]|uniref:sensor domain-containing diguanylate cyclase n=1 Tax=Neptuniibacter halophilus TaxID=651666 RepID=UPI00257278AA|nr:sensor domain-containing diguanylate cyclase [Neptuniibacter halophilus]